MYDHLHVPVGTSCPIESVEELVEEIREEIINDIFIF